MLLIDKCQLVPIQTILPTAQVSPGETLHWFDAPIGGTEIFNPSLSIVDSVDFYAESQFGVAPNICYSPTRTKVTLEIYPLPLAPVYNNNDITECALNPIQTLTAVVTAQPNTSIDWYVVPSGGLPLSVAPTLNTPTSIDYYAESVADVTLCKSTTRTKVTLTINPTPAAPTTLNAVDRQCQLVPIQTILPTAQVSPGETLHWFDAPIGGTEIFNPSLSIVDSVDFYAESQFGVAPNICYSPTRTKVTLEIYPLVTKPTVDPAGVFTACETSPTQTLTASAIAPSGTTLLWYNDATGGTPLSNVPTLSNVSTATYYAESKDITTNCVSLDRLPVTLTIKIVPDFVIKGGCSGGKYVLESTPSTNSTYDPATATYDWTNSSGTSLSQTATFIVTQPGTYNCKITNAEGCSFIESYPANNISCVIQKGISPKGVNGGDGSNDYFDLSALNVSSLEIFNRYGLKTYSKDNYQDQWYGQSDDGQELPDGTYYYVIKLTDGDAKTGWIYINREQ